MITAGTKLQYKKDAEYVVLGKVLSVPDLGQGSTEKIDVTTLEDSSRVYESGLKNLGDNLSFEFLYDGEVGGNFETVQEITKGKKIDWRVVFPDTVCFDFTGEASYTILGFAPGDVIKMRLDITPSTAITIGKVLS